MYFCSVKIKEVLCALEQFAPLPLQESWDNAGLQVGLTEVEVSGALLCLDVNEKILDEAIRKGCNLVVSHHPLLFRGLKTISDQTDVQRTVRKAIKHDLCVISMHTNMDNAKGGVNYRIAQKLGLQNITFFSEKRVDGLEAGSGVIGELSERKHYVNIWNDDDNGLAYDNTNSMGYHEYFGHEQEIQIAVIGHYQSEQFTSELLKEIIERDCPGVPCYQTKLNTNPILYL